MIKPEKAKGSQLRQQKISLRFPKTGGVFGWFPLAMTVVNTCFQLDSDIQVVVSWLAIDENDLFVQMFCKIDEMVVVMHFQWMS